MLHAKDLIPGRAARFLAAPLLLAPLALGSGVALGASSLDGGLIWAADMRPPSVIRVSDPARDVVVYEYRVNSATEGACSGDALCYLTGTRYVKQGGRDYFDVVLNVSDRAAPKEAERKFSALQRVRATPDSEVVFELLDLDFTNLPGGEAYCRQDPLDPCGTRDDARCRLVFAEGFDVVHDEPEAQTITVVVADAENDRMLQATLDYAGGNTCARVDWAMGDPDPEWPGAGLGTSWPNSVKYVEQGEGDPVVLVSFFITSLTGAQLYAYRLGAAGPELAWRFPEAEGDILNTPHMLEMLTNPLTGARELWYSHSRGAAPRWQADVEDYGATWGKLALGETLDAPPTYLWEAGIWDDAGTPIVKFTRDQAYLEDGSMLLTDAGCQNVCPNEGVIYHVDGAALSGPGEGKSGAFTPNHGDQTFLDLPASAILSEHRCGYGALFETGYLQDGALGADLSAAGRGRGRRCPK